EGPRHGMRTDTLRLKVSYGTLGKREGGRGTGKATLTLSVEGRRLASQSVALPDSGALTTEITLPASHVPRPGWSVLDVRIEGVSDQEPRDDSRQFVVDVSLEPAAVIFASPPDWEARFLARTLSDVARLPVRVFVETEAGRWRDGATLAPVATADLTRAAVGARLVIATGDPQRAREFTAGPARAARSSCGRRMARPATGTSSDRFPRPSPRHWPASSGTRCRRRPPSRFHAIRIAPRPLPSRRGSRGAVRRGRSSRSSSAIVPASPPSRRPGCGAGHFVPAPRS